MQMGGGRSGVSASTDSVAVTAAPPGCGGTGVAAGAAAEEVSEVLVIESESEESYSPESARWGKEYVPEPRP